MTAPTLRRWMLLAAAGAVLVLIVGLLALGGVNLLRRQPSLPPGATPISQLDPKAIDPATALGSLAGMQTERELIDQALREGKLDTAYAALAFNISLTDAERASNWLALGQRLAAAKKPTSALLAYRAAVNLALLSPDWHDYLRATLLLQAGQGLASIGERDEAKAAYDGVDTIARYSPHLQAGHRVRLLQDLAQEYAAIGQQAKAAEEKLAAASEIPPWEAPPFSAPPAILPVSWMDNPDWAKAQGAETERTKAARSLALFLKGNPNRPAEALRQALETSLLAEDRLKTQFFNDALPKATDLGLRQALAQGRLDWLTLKWRVALKGYGLSIVPAWESRLREIQADMFRAHQDLALIQREIATGQPDAVEAAHDKVSVAMDELKWSRLGLYPGAAEDDLIDALEQAIGERIDLHLDDSLYPKAVSQENGTVFTVVTADAYTQ